MPYTYSVNESPINLSKHNFLNLYQIDETNLSNITELLPVYPQDTIFYNEDDRTGINYPVTGYFCVFKVTSGNYSYIRSGGNNRSVSYMCNTLILATEDANEEPVYDWLRECPTFNNCHNFAQEMYYTYYDENASEPDYFYNGTIDPLLINGDYILDISYAQIKANGIYIFLVTEDGLSFRKFALGYLYYENSTVNGDMIYKYWFSDKDHNSNIEFVFGYDGSNSSPILELYINDSSNYLTAAEKSYIHSAIDGTSDLYACLYISNNSIIAWPQV